MNIFRYIHLMIFLLLFINLDLHQNRKLMIRINKLYTNSLMTKLVHLRTKIDHLYVQLYPIYILLFRKSIILIIEPTF